MPTHSFKVPLPVRHIVARVVRWRPVLWALRVAVKALTPKHRVGVAAIVMDGNGRVLLLKHVFHPTSPWAPPGGWLDRGEAPRQGAGRELREETGLKAEVGPLLYMRRERIPDHIAMAFLVHIPAATRPEELTLSSEILEAAWFPADELPPRLTSFNRKAIQCAQQRRGAQPTTRISPDAVRSP